MSVATAERLRESVHQTSELRVRKGDLVITRDELDKGRDWEKHPGEVVIESVRVMNAESRNGYRYSQSALQDVARHHSERPVGVEHEDSNPQQMRLWESRLGQLRNGRVTPDGKGVVADWHLDLGLGQRARKAIVEAVRYPSNLMFSIEVDAGDWEGEQLAESGVTQVTKIDRMLDTALVSRGGTTNRINESLRGAKSPSKPDEDDDMADKITTVSELRTAHPRLVEQLLDEPQKASGKLQEQVDSLTKENGELKARIAEGERRSKVRKDAETAGVKLTEEQVTRLSKFTDEELAADLDERKKLAEGVKHQDGGYAVPPSGEKDAPAPSGAAPWWQSTGIAS